MLLNKVVPLVSILAVLFAPALTRAQTEEDVKAPELSGEDAPAPESDLTSYSTTPMGADAEKPGACVWNIGPQVAGDKELIAVLITAGFLAADNPMNFKTLFLTIVQDTEGQAFNLGDVSYSTTIAATGTDVSSREMETQSKPGEKHELHMPLDATFNFLDGIKTSGLQLRAEVAGTGEIVEHSFSPPPPGDVAIYTACLTKLARSIEQSQAAESP